MGRRNETFDVISEVDHHAFFLYADDRSRLLHARCEPLRDLRPWIVVQLFESERDAFVLAIHVENHDLDLFALLDNFRGVLHALRPAHVRNVDQPVDPRLDFDERAERGEVSDRTSELRTGRILDRKPEPRILFDLLHPERDFLVRRIDLENHCLDLISKGHELGGVPDIACPGHLRDMDQSLDTLLELDERTVVGDRYHPAPDTGADRVLLVDVGPRVREKLLESERNPLAVPIDIQHLHVDGVGDLDDFRRMPDPTPGHVRDVEKSVQAAEVDERTEISDVLHDAFSDLPDEELPNQRLLLLLALGLQNDPARHHDVTPPLVELDDLEVVRLPQQVFDVRDPAQRDLRPGKEGIDTHDIDCDPTLDLP